MTDPWAAWREAAALVSTRHRRGPGWGDCQHCRGECHGSDEVLLARAVAALLPVRDAADRAMTAIRECELLQGHEHSFWHELDAALAAAQAVAEGGTG